jgi:formylglycine-generating enzyme required for sulfatase activity
VAASLPGKDFQVPTAKGTIVFHDLSIRTKRNSILGDLEYYLGGTVENTTGASIVKLSFRANYSAKHSCPDAFKMRETLPPGSSWQLNEYIGLGSLGCRSAEVIGVTGLEGIYSVEYEFSMMPEVQEPSLLARVSDRFSKSATQGTSFEDRLFRIVFQPGPSRIGLSITNKAGIPAKLDWNAVSYVDPQGRAHRVVHSGVRLLNKGESQAPTIIPAASRIEDYIAPVDNVNFLSDHWLETDILPGGASLLTSEARVETRSVAGDKLAFSDFEASGDFPGQVGGMRNKQFAVFLPLELEGRSRNYRFVFKITDVKPHAATAVLPAKENSNLQKGKQTARLAEKRQVPSGFSMEFVRIPAGEFVMGSMVGYEDEKPVHRVRITRAFELGRCEVTQAQWKAVMGTNPSTFQGADLPVETVSWNDVQRFLSKLNAWADGYRYRLPTEAEWEYAARGGAAGDSAVDLDRMAWYRDNSNGPHPVGRKVRNTWGLYDMLGNVWEWCQDWYGSTYYRDGPVDDPKGPKSGTEHVLRGGSWGDGPRGVRAAARLWDGSDYRDSFAGFRCARERIP